MREDRIDGFRRTMGTGHSLLARHGLRTPVLVLEDGQLRPETDEDTWTIETIRELLAEGKLVETDHFPVTVKDEDGTLHGSDALVQDEDGRWSFRKGDNDGQD